MATPSISPPTGSSSPPPSLSPPPAVSSPPKAQPNAGADPPTASSSPPPTPHSPPPESSSSPPPLPISPPPASPPPVVLVPPPAAASPPTPSASPPPPIAEPPASSPPPPSAAPPVHSPSPPSATIPVGSPPPSSFVPSPPVVVPSPPAGSPPPPVKSPPPPAKQSPPSPSGASPPLPVNPSPSPPPAIDSPPAETQVPPPPTALPPSTNSTEPPPLSPSPPGILPSPPRSSPGSPPSGQTPSAPSPPSTDAGPPRAPQTTVPSGPNSTKTSNSTPGPEIPGNVDSSRGGGISTGAAVGIGLAVSFVVLGFIGVVLWSAKKRKKHERGFAASYVNVMPSPFQSSQMSASESPFLRSPTVDMKNSSGSQGFASSPPDAGLGYSKSLFSYEELSQITNGFSEQNLLGEGGFGCVYKGYLPDGREVAVKQLKDGGGQGEREFRAEVEIISRIHHRHLVSLVGCCISENQRLLVYDYVPNNTLHYHLHGVDRPVMDWATRLKVALGAARGLSYLHEDCHPRVIHRDIKSSNILLDHNFEAQVSDFGLAKLAMDSNTHVTTRVMGTFGYLAPEYASSGKLTDKSDVFSFGVVLLELITGRKPVDTSQPLGDESLVEWARPLMVRSLETGDFKDLPDPRLKKNYDESEMFRMIEVAAGCVRHSAPMRPRMGQVVRALDGLGDSMDLHNGMKPGQSELFNSAQQSAEIRLFQRMAFGSQDYSSDFSRTSWRSRRDL